MFVIVHHQLTDPPTAFERGKRLMTGEGAPVGVRVLQFLPSRDGDVVTCLWQAEAVASVQTYVDDTLGAASINSCYEVDAEHAFADDLRQLKRSPAPAR
jgi:hypothetical protein